MNQMHHHGDRQFGALSSSEYGKLFGQGGTLQRIFAPRQFQSFIDQGGTSQTFIQKPVSLGPKPEGGLFTRLFSRDPAKVEIRQRKRFGGSMVTDPETGKRLRINKDGTVTQFKVNKAGDLVPGKSFSKGSNTAVRAMKLARRQRAGAIIGGVGAAAGLIPGVLALLGLRGGEEERGGPVTDVGIEQAAPAQSNLVPILLGVGGLLLVTVLVAGKRTPAPTSSPRRRAR
jgi:hypothetical protein